MGEISLAGSWRATWGDGGHAKMDHHLKAVEDAQRYMEMVFPGSIQHNLEKAGLLDDPRLGLNALKARWVEEHFWILRRNFYVPPDAPLQEPFLHMQVVDGVSEIILNGELVAEHANSHRPLVVDISSALKSGMNELVILLESGLYKTADLDGSDYNFQEEAALNKRQFLRQPQFQFGWDWNPRLIFFGLHGEMKIVWGPQPRLEQVSVISEVSPDLQTAHIFIRPTWWVPGNKPMKIVMSLTSRDALTQTATATLEPGRMHAELVLEVKQPKLWWPHGYGPPEVYPLNLSILADDKHIINWAGKTGLRRVTIEQKAHPEKGRYFHLMINNRLVFCKGSNWVPPEMSAYEVSPDKVKKLVDLAIEQNFNMLRIWGGAVWAGHPLLELCDEKGIMVWHDLLFACSKYPADNPDFLKEVQTEVEWGLKEFSLHPSLVVWCGNNEIEWGWWDWHYRDFGRTAPDYALFHQIFPMLTARHCPVTPYWPSSPYSDAVTPANDDTVGDQHPWFVTLDADREAADFWRYRSLVDRFPNEGGVLGCSPVDSLRQFLNAAELKPRSFAWELHYNTANFWNPRPGTPTLHLERFLNLRPAALSLAEYAIASGMMQAEGLKEYIRNYRRRTPSSASAIYWDYTDSWPSVHGWGTLDYYLRRRPSFHVVRRAFAPVIVVLVDEERTIGVYLINDSPKDQMISLSAGDFAATGGPRMQAQRTVPISAFTCLRTASLIRDPGRVAFAQINDADKHLLDWDRLLLRPFREWDVASPTIQVSTEDTALGRFARYQSADWIWNVVLDPSGSIDTRDDIFDLLPGQPYDIPLESGEEARPVRYTGNQLILKGRQK